MKKILLMTSVLAVVLILVAFAENKAENIDSERPFLSVGLTGLYPRPEEIDEDSETVFTFKQIPIKAPLIKIEKNPRAEIKPKKEKKIVKKAPKRKISEKGIRTLEEVLYEDTTNEVLKNLGYIE